MTKWFDNLIRNAREGALEAVGELLEIARGNKDADAKTQLAAIKELVRMCTTKEALAVPEKQLEDYDLIAQRNLLTDALAEVDRKLANSAVQHETVQ